MTELFVNHNISKIQLAHPGFAAVFFTALVFLLSIVSVRKRDIRFLDFGTSLEFRGVAILLLICGHFFEMCLQHDDRLAIAGGFLAVCIFLFLSGFGLVQRYGYEKIDGKFWPKRLLRLFIPLWLCLIIFILLDKILLKLPHPLWEIALNFCGVMFNGAFVRVDSPAWFIDYILLQYIVFFFIFRSSLGLLTKTGLLFFISTGIALFVYTTSLFNYFSIWLQYTLVFPLGVLVGVVARNSNFLDTSSGSMGMLFASIISVPVSILALVMVGQLGSRLGLHPKLFLQQTAVLTTVISGGYLLCTLGIESRFLVFMGKYSFEIFLLHLPFMVKYDFILFRKPFVVTGLVYLGVIIFMAVIVQKVSNMIRRVIEPRFSF